MFKQRKLKTVQLVDLPAGSLISVFNDIKKKRSAMISLAFIILLVLIAIFVDLIAPFDMRTQDLSNTLASPSFTHIMGTDELGRDVFSRILFGTRTSLLIGVVSVLISLILGGILGVISGYFGKMTDNIIMRICDVLLSIPSILLAIAIVASLGAGVVNMIVAIAVANVPIFARIIRSGVISVKERQFIEAAHAIGSSNYRIIIKHIIPNITSAIIVQSTIGIAVAILSAAGLGFIGLGTEASIAEWGTMLSLGRTYIRTHPYLTYFPGLAIMLTILAFNILGDAIRDALDPRYKER